MKIDTDTVLKKVSPQGGAPSTENSFTKTETVGGVAWSLAWHRYRNTTWFVIVVCAVVFFLHYGFTLALLFVYAAYIYNKAHKWFMRQFALANNLEYVESLPMDSVNGRLFDLGHSREISNAVIGEFDGHPMKLFNYQYTIGSGKHQTTHSFTVCEVAFEKTSFPHILLQSKTMSKYADSDYFGEDKDVSLPLEGKFTDSFALYATQNYEIEVFEIFTPEVLLFLEEQAANFSIEFAGNKMYIYDDTIVSRKSKLVNMYEVVGQIYDRIGLLLDRLHDDFSALHGYYR